MRLITFLFMKNGFITLIFILLLCLTSCKRDHDTFLTQAMPITEEMALKDSTIAEKPFSLPYPILNDSSKYYFFVENEAGVVDYSRYDFDKLKWQSVSALFHHSFIGGPLGTGRIIYQQNLWRDTAMCMLYGHNVERNMILEVEPLAEIAINDDPSKSVYIWVPTDSELRLSDCNHIDEWFTFCNQQRFFVQYWIEQQFEPRYIKRIQWKPFSVED